jgi:hypothetical protein
MEFDSPEMKFD